MNEDNEIRLSQLILTYGPGALVDLPNSSVIVMGLDHWRFSERGSMREIHEPRLAKYLTELLKNPQSGKSPWIEDGVNLSLFEPPLNESDGFEKAKKVPVRHYPEWEVVSDPSNPKEQSLQRRTSGKKKKTKKGIVKTPVRWISACTNGHMQDINWRSFAHSGKQGCSQDLYLTDSGTGGDPQYIRVSCRCGASRKLSEMYIGNTLGNCTGNRPWLGSKFREPDCGETLAPMTRGAINNYYSQTLKLIALPVEQSSIVELINEWLPRFDPISTKEMIPVLWGDAAMASAFEGFSLDEIWSALLEVRDDTSQSASGNVDNPKIAEFDLFACGAPTIGTNALGARFHGETMKDDEWRKASVFNTEFISSLVKIHRMCEVSALYGFTRIAPAPSPFEDGLEDIKLEVKGQSLGSKIKWLPAMEQFGEGLFLHLDADEIRKRLSKGKATLALKRLEQRYRDWHSKDTANRQDYPGHEYVIAHSLSHMLIEQIALDAGYPSTSLTERIYALRGMGSGKVSRLGVLIYAAGGGSLGTLGGLLEQAERLPQLISNGVKRQQICSNDPICFTHSEVLTAEADMINGAACHGCLFTAETSCERRNILLDRTSLLEILNPPQEIASNEPFLISSGTGQLFNLIEFSAKIFDYAESNPGKQIAFFFEDKFFFDPFAFLYLGLILKNIQSRFGNSLHFENPDKASYGGNIGFFKLLGFDYGKDVGESEGNDKYLPITKIDIPDQNIDIDEVHAEVVERMQVLGEEFAKRLLKTDKGSAFDALAYFFREILRNVIEHSYSDTLYYSAQAYKNNKVLLVIADEGEGMLESLNNNPNLNIQNDKDAVEHAVMPGMSGRAHKYSGSRSKNNIYKNTGYGLFLTKEICSANGDFTLISNSAGIFAKEKRLNNIKNSPLQGTILRLVIRLDEVGDINSRLKSIIEKVRVDLKNEGKIFNRPSGASTNVRLD